MARIREINSAKKNADFLPSQCYKPAINFQFIRSMIMSEFKNWSTDQKDRATFSWKPTVEEEIADFQAAKRANYIGVGIIAWEALTIAAMIGTHPGQSRHSQTEAATIQTAAIQAEPARPAPSSRVPSAAPSASVK